MAKTINDLVHTVFKTDQNWKFKLHQDWPSIMGNLSSFVFLEKIEGDTVIVTVNDSCWLQELYLLSPVLLKTINEKLDNQPIKQLRFKLRGTQKTQQRVYQAPVKPTPVPVNLSITEKQTLARIEDSELRGALEQFLIRCYREK